MAKILKTSLLQMVLSLMVGLLITAEPASAYVASEYQTDAELAIGSLVSLNDEGELVPSSSKMMNYIGVVTARDDGVVEVATSGTVPLLVSDVDGEITDGTQLGLSNIAGVASKSSQSDTSIGIVTASPVDWRERSIEGQQSTVSVGTAAVKLVERKSTGRAEGNSYLSALQRIANGVAGREVDTWRAVTALLIGLGGVVLAFVLLMSSSRSSFLSLGRNPMAGGAIMKGLWKVAAVAVIILLVSLISAYAIVRSG